MQDEKPTVRTVSPRYYNPPSILRKSVSIASTPCIGFSGLCLELPYPAVTTVIYLANLIPKGIAITGGEGGGCSPAPYIYIYIYIYTTIFQMARVK